MTEMRQRLITGALLVTAGGFAAGAWVFTADWQSCRENEGGVACREPRNLAAGAWAALATNALALATNTIQENDR